jgi:hypothetical protein
MNERRKVIRDLTARYGLQTKRSLFGSPGLEGVSENTIDQLVTREVRDGGLASYPLYGPMHYFSLTPRTARELGLSPKRYERGMGLQALIQNYSILAYCRLGETKRQRMTRDEFTSRFPKLVGVGLGTSRYFLDDDGEKVRLSLFLPDFDSDFRRLIRKTRREIQKRRDHSNPETRAKFRAMLAGDNFSLTVLTAFREKAERIETGLSDEPFRAKVEVVPEFANLLTGGAHGRA